MYIHTYIYVYTYIYICIFTLCLLLDGTVARRLDKTVKRDALANLAQQQQQQQQQQDVTVAHSGALSAKLV